MRAKLDREVIWIEPNPAYLRQMRILGIALAGFMWTCSLLGMGVAYMIGGGDIDSTSRAILVLPFVIIALPLILVGELTRRAFATHFARLRLGVSSAGFHAIVTTRMRIQAPPKTVGPVPWERIFFDGHRLLVDGTLVSISNPAFGPAVFPRTEFDALILPRIPRKNRVSRAVLNWKAWSAMPLALKLAGIAIVTVILTLEALKTA